MKVEIRVPSMGESISEVVIGSILTPSGSSVKADEAVLEIETDKVNQVLYAPQNGTITLQIQTGDVVKIGQTIGFVEATSGESFSEKKIPEEPPKKENKEPVKEPVLATPEQKVIEPSSHSLRQTKAQYLSEINKKIDRPKAIEPKSEQKIVDSARETRTKMTNIRRVIAKRLVEVQQVTAMLTTFNEADLSQVIQLREKYKEAFMKAHGVKLGFMSFFIKAVVSALEAFPGLNSYIDGEDIIHRKYYDIGVAVGTDKGLFVPVIRNCDQLSFAQIESSLETFAKSAREGKIKLEDLQGGGFTITNGGVYGSLLSTPILNPPQSGILGMHKIQKRPVVVDDVIVIRSMMYLALSYDHRVVDGKEAVGFLVHIKNLLEDPSRFVLDV